MSTLRNVPPMVMHDCVLSTDSAPRVFRISLADPQAAPLLNFLNRESGASGKDRLALLLQFNKFEGWL